MLSYSWILLIIFSTPVMSAGKIKTIYQWSWVDYLWDSNEQKIQAIQSGDYNYTKPVILDVDVWKDQKIFVTVIRSKGVPASLTIISNEIGNGGPLLKPYPNWSWAEKNNCLAITSVWRVAIDECDRLWVLDTGRVDGKRICPAQLLVFNLNNDRLIERIIIDDHISVNEFTGLGFLVTPIVTTSGNQCQETRVYIADVDGHALIVYDGSSMWRLDSTVFLPQQKYTNITVADQTFYLNDGILGMAVSPIIKNYRYLVFRPLASRDMFYTEINSLDKSYNDHPVGYSVVTNILPSQAAAMAFSKDGTLFFGLTKEIAIACWNIKMPLKRKNIVILDQDEYAYQFASGVKIIPERITGRKEELWIATNRYQKIATNTQNFNEINFRILRAQVDDLIVNTNCNA